MITEREQLIADARQTAAELDVILTSMASGLVIYDREGRILRCNPEAERILGFTPEERLLTLKERLQVIRLETPAGDACPFDETPTARALRGETIPGEELILVRGDIRRWMLITAVPIKDANGEIQSVVTTLTDITERKHFESALRESEETARALLNATIDAALLLEQDGVILAANVTLARLLGKSREEIMGMNILELLPSSYGQECLHHAKEVFVTGTGVRFEANDGERWFDTTIHPIKDAEERIVRLAVFSRDITDNKQLADRLHFLAYYDHLTGLPNRFMLQDRLQHLVTRMKRHPAFAAVLFLDLDNFKKINDTYGHSVGDFVLREVAQRLGRCIRQSDTVARMGGDEFVIILTDLKQPLADVELTAGRILQALEIPCQVAEQSLPIGTSIGIALAPADGNSPDILLKNADVAMYRAKDKGRGRFCFFADGV